MAKEMNVLVVTGQELKTVKDGIAALKDVKPRVQTVSLADGWNYIVEYKPNVVICVAQEQYEEYMQLIKKIKAYYHGVSIIVISDNADSEYILHAYKAGIKDFLKITATSEEIQQAVQKLYREVNEVEKHAALHSRVISVFSNKGGIGVTSVAVNLASALAEIKDAKVVLCDFVFQHSDIAIFLDTPTKCTISDVISNMNRIDKIFLENTLSKTEDGLYVIHGPDKPEEGDYINAMQIEELIHILKTYFDYIIIDTNHSYNDNNITMFDSADMILLLLTLELPSICNCGKTLEVFQKLRYERDKVKLVVNRTNARNQIDVQLVEEQLNYPIFAQLPNDYLTVVKGINNGQSIFRSAKVSAMGTALRALRDQILKEMNKEFPEDKKGFLNKLFKK